MSIIRKEQLTNPLSASYALTASYALSADVTFNTSSLLITASATSNTITFTKGDTTQFSVTVNTGSAATIDTSSLVTTSSFNAFTASINIFTSSYNTGSFSGSFTGSLNGTASTASYYQETDPVFVAKSASFATTGSNTFTGDQIINGENLGLIVDAGGLKRVGFMKYGGLEGSIVRVADQNFRILRTAGSDINDGTNAITDFYIAGDGKIGIGTTSPAYALDVSGSSNFIGDQTITGSINFGDGSLIQSISASSGDGGGYTTLTLKPNTSVASDQYIILDPTTPNHIHIRAGGLIDSSSAYLYLGGEKANVVVRNLDNSFNEKYWVQINSQTGSTQSTWIFDDNGVLIAPGRIDAPSFSGSFTGSFNGTASWAENAQTASYIDNLNQNLTLSGSLTITQNLTVLGSQSIQYITSSQLDISTNLITVNTSTPAVRFGGLAVRDSGSLATGLTGSLLWDSQNNVWIYSNPSGSAYDGGLLLTGPRNTSGLGNEVGITTNVLAKGDGSHHMTSSQISDNGTTVTIPGNLSVGTTNITGSLLVNNGTYDIISSTNEAIFNSNGSASIGWGNRILYASDGATPSLNWSSNLVTTSPTFFTHTISATSQEDFSSTTNYAGTVIRGTIDGDVIPYDVVCLRTDGAWYQNDQTSERSSKKLGIYLDNNLVLLEGHIVIGLDLGVQAADLGVPIFIRNSSGTNMSTLPPTSGYVRILGHIYYQNQNDPNLYIMRFNPSNDYYLLG